MAESENDIDTIDSFMRLPSVLKKIPISRSAWLKGVQEGRFPRPVKLGPRTSAWITREIRDLAHALAAKQSTPAPPARSPRRSR